MERECHGTSIATAGDFLINIAYLELPMRREIPAVRILPMSDQADGFRGRTVEDVQRGCFLRDLPRGKGRWRYQASGLNAQPGTVVLFQFKARIIASGVFLRDEKFERLIKGY